MPADQATGSDPYLWLEEVHGQRTLAWVRERNAESRAQLETHPLFATLRDGLRAMLDAADKIPHVSRRGDALYNLWRDAGHPRGLWRRTTLASYRLAQPAWETVIDLDALARDEGENWVWAGASGLGPDYRRCLVQLSRGGADATVLREFDTVAKQFVAGGFALPEAKTQVAWETADSLLVGTDFGPGSLTDSGYPRLIKRWRRGQPLADAVTVFEGQARDVSVSASVDRTPGHGRSVVSRATDFYNAEQFLLDGVQLRRIAIPSDADIHFWGARALLQLRSDWSAGGGQWPAGSLLVGDARAILAADDAAAMPPLTALFSPTATRALAGFATTRSRVLVEVLDNVAGRLEAWWPGDDAGNWQHRELATPFPGTLSVAALHDPELADDDLAESFLLSYADFLTPDALLLGDTGSDGLQPLKSRFAQFDSAGLRVDQRFATSKDGTRVPYFEVGAQGRAAGIGQPTLLYGYGGFEVSQQPWYSAGFGIDRKSVV